MAQRWTDPDPDVDDRSWMDACVDRYMGGQGPYAGRGPARTRSDAVLHEAVSERLAQDRLLDARGIIVEIEDGIVSLEGQVHRPSDRRLADLLAIQVEGVIQVRNHLAVQPDLFGEAPAFRPFNRQKGGSLGHADRAEAELHPVARSLPPFIT